MNLIAEFKALVAAAAILTALPLLIASAFQLPERLGPADLSSALHYFSSVSL